MLQLQNVSLSFSNNVILENTSFQFPLGKTAILGPNGIGKSSLFRLITGIVSSQKGSVVKSKGFRIAHLEQDLVIESTENLLNFTLHAFKELYSIETLLLKKQNELAVITDKLKFDQISAEIEKLTHQFELQNGYAIESEAKKILSGLGFAKSDFNKDLSSFSGGWRIRAFLAQLLLQKPDFLLLDEPTNHLDLEAMIWLEDYLINYEKSLLIISHDRRFLDRIVNQSIEIDKNQLTLYKGNVSFFETAKEEKMLLLEKQNMNMNEQIEHIQRFVERFRSKATKAKQVQSRLKLLEKLQLNTIQNDKKSVNFNFRLKNESSKIVFECKSLSKSYDQLILDAIDLIIYRGDKIAILGPNGSGKSTFLKILANILQLDSGELISNPRVKIGYFSQHQLESMDKNATIYEEIERVSSDDNRLNIRQLLGAFLFSGDAINKKIDILSGGEKSRVALAKIFASDANTLLLDEPTNHLDTQTKEALQLALSEFNGTIISISHDREFLESIFDKFYYLKDAKFTYNDCTYQEFEEKQFSTLPPPADIQTVKSAYKDHKQNRNKRNQLIKEIDIAENELDQLESEKKIIESEMFDIKNPQDLMEKQKKIDNLNMEIESKMKIWEMANERFEKWNLNEGS